MLCRRRLLVLRTTRFFFLFSPVFFSSISHRRGLPRRVSGVRSGRALGAMHCSYVMTCAVESPARRPCKVKGCKALIHHCCATTFWHENDLQDPEGDKAICMDCYAKLVSDNPNMFQKGPNGCQPPDETWKRIVHGDAIDLCSPDAGLFGEEGAPASLTGRDLGARIAAAGPDACSLEAPEPLPHAVHGQGAFCGAVE